MNTDTSPSPTPTPPAEMLVRGIAAARAGDDIEALRLLRRVTEMEPGNVEAWVWRASVAENPADKKAFLEEALTLDPNNVEAKLALERLIEIEGELAERIGEEEVLYCTVHPDRETMLRCNRCGRPMCTECAVRHPVGLRCRECVNQTRSPIYQVSTGASARGLLAATLISTIVGGFVLVVGIPFFFWFFIGGAIGRAIAEVVQRAVPRKRGAALQTSVGVGIVLGLLIAAVGLAVVLAGNPLAAVALLFRNPLNVLLYLGTAITAAVASLR
jgi:hypothetical protein